MCLGCVGDREVCVWIHGCVAHCSFKGVVGVLSFKAYKALDEPLRRRGLRVCVVSEPLGYGEVNIVRVCLPAGFLGVMDGVRQ